MAIIHTVEQNTPAWHRLRAGIPTASEFDKIITPKTGELSKSADSYMYRLLAEYMVGHPITGPENEAMARGSALEGQASEAFSFETDFVLERIGFITTDDGMIGCSPDRKIAGENALAEIKCPITEAVHVKYLMTGSIADEYRAQIQGQMYVGGYERVYAISFHPEFPLCVVRVDRDEKFISKLSAALSEFVARLLEKRAELEVRFGPFVPIGSEAAAADLSFDITDADVDAIWAASQKGA